MAGVPKDIAEALTKAAPRPADDAAQGEKRKYAERLSNELAVLVANCLRDDFPGVLPDTDGKGKESKARTSKGVKSLDVNYSTTQLGLALGVSIKTNNIRDKNGKGRYTHNYPRVDDELRAEAMDYHVRQPYATMVALYFMPLDSCDDSKKGHPSSFGACVKKFRWRACRKDPDDSPELFEVLLIGLYDPGTGAVSFFDVGDDPPKGGRPAPENLMDLPEAIDRIRDVYDQRNNPPFRWDDETDDETEEGE